MSLILVVNKRRPKIKLFNLSLVVLLVLSSIAFSQIDQESVISKKLILKAKKEKVWSALTDKNALSKWWHQGVVLEPYIGGKFYEPWGDNQLATGEVKNIRITEYIEFTWKEKYWASSESTICRFTLKEVNNITTLDIKHSGWETFKDEENRKKLIQGFHKGWDLLLPKLKRYLLVKSP